MILSGKEIIKQVYSENIIIRPFDVNNINPNSYNYRLGHLYTMVNGAVDPDVQPPGSEDLQIISEKGLLLQPGKLYLAHTYEIIGSNKFVTKLIGRSSLGRLGLFLQITADLGNLGPAHKWTLELTCVQPIIIYPHMIIGQVTFWEPCGDITEYKGMYTNYNIPKDCDFKNLFGADNDLDRKGNL
jgi:dCTP deaminase